jgi:hypothetical protein
LRGCPVSGDITDDKVWASFHQMAGKSFLIPPDSGGNPS